MVRAWFVLAVLAFPSAVWAQFGAPPAAAGARLGESKTQKYKTGIIVRAKKGACADMFGTVPIPIDWPEQQVSVYQEQLSPQVRKIDYRDLEAHNVKNLGKQLLVDIPQLAAGGEAQAILTFEIRRQALLPPEDTSIYRIPKQAPREAKGFLGTSPQIETTHPKIKALAKEIPSDQPTDWQKVEAIYDAVRAKVQYENGDAKGAVAALRDGKGDCEELTGLFIAVCRSRGIPARTVWVTGHCYPEFYLVDPQGKGHWFPCQAAGDRSFGGIAEFRPILQKGDDFRVPEKKEKLRYVDGFFTGKPVVSGGKPSLQWVKDVVP